MKKILASLASLAIIGSSVTSVVSCGPVTFSKLMNRTVSTDVYRGTYKAPITNWSSAVTMQLDDSVILTNAQDTLLATDQYNQFEGDLADRWGSSDDKKTWFFHVRDNEYAGHWTSLDKNGHQKDEGVIKPIDFFNTFRFVFNPNNMSQTVGIWQTVVKNGSQLNQFIAAIRDENNPLYDDHFVKLKQTNAETVKSNTYIDRAILAFNLTEDPVESRRIALDMLGTPWPDLIVQSFQEGHIINNGSDRTDGSNLVFNLEKPVPYFDSMAAFLSYAPMPDISVKYENVTASGSNYGRALGNKFGYQTIYYSGAYVVSDYNPTLKIKMVQNKFYFNRKSLHVKELNYAYIGNVDVSRQRFYFETGDISEVILQPTDLAGWRKYVGSDLENLNFQGANLTSRPQAGTFAMVYNYKSTREDEFTAASNIALSQRSVRGFIRYVFDRSRVASYYSKAMDKTGTSTTLRNSWTSKNLAIVDPLNPQETDYANYLTKDYFDMTNPTNNETVSGWLNQALNAYGLTPENYATWSQTYGTQKDHPDKNALSDGYDPFMYNDLLGALIFVNDNHGTLDDTITPKNEALFREYVPLIGTYTSEAENKKLSLIKQQVREDLQPYNLSGATLTWLANGALSTTMNNNVKDAVRTFNQRAGGDSPIKFKVEESTDMNDYRVKTESGKFSVISNGWVPDYADPYTFLHAIVAGGDLQSYYGFGRLFDQTVDDQGKITLKVKDSIPYKEAYEDLKTRAEIFANRVSEIDKTEANPDSRYKAFAAIENYAMIETMMVQPLLFQTLDEPPMISYVNPFTRSTYTSGQALFRFVGVQMIPKLWDHQTFAKKKEEWEAHREDYTSTYIDETGNFKEHFNGKWNG